MIIYMKKIYLFETNLKNSKNNKYCFVNDVNNADFILIIHKIKSKETGIKFVNENNYEIISHAYNLAKSSNKKLIIYCGGDRPPQILPNYDNVIVLNTSVIKSTKPFNEYVVGVTVEDKFSHFMLEPDLTIGFVGQKCCGREKYLNYLKNQEEFKTNFITRDAYIHKLHSHHINEFDNNMNENLFTFCYRGAGNFSVRFYETIMRGRIPIVVKTNSVFPYENLIDYDKVGIFVEENELNENNTLKDIILKYYNGKSKDELVEIQKYNRDIYLTYFNHDVFWEQILNYL